MIGVRGIRRILPHRHPILLVDVVTDVEPGSRLTAHKAVTANEPCYRHLGDDAEESSYAYPVGLLLESWAQSSLLLVCWQRPNPDVLAGKVELASGIRKVDVLAAAYPGDLVEHRVETVRVTDDAAIVTGASLVNGRTIMSVGQFSVALRDVDELSPVLRKEEN